MVDLEKLKETNRKHRKVYAKSLQLMRKKRDNEIDAMLHEAHEKAFDCTDCLECANCCKTTGPLFTNQDIKRISKYLRMSEYEFTNKYLRMDEDDDLVLKVLPCPFLDENDNECTIYDKRPKACKDYPNTDLPKQIKYFQLTLRNNEICPAVNNMMETITRQVNNDLRR